MIAVLFFMTKCPWSVSRPNTCSTYSPGGREQMACTHVFFTRCN